MSELPSTELTFQRLELALEGLQNAWNKEASPPNLIDFLPTDLAERHIILSELIKLDLDCRWLQFNFPKRLTEYQIEFPEIAGNKMPLDLVLEEIHVRRESGFEIQLDDYVELFPHLKSQLGKVLLSESAGHSTAIKSHLQTYSQLKQKYSKLQAGDFIEDFELLTELGQGAFAKVYLARQSSMQRLVALKVSASKGEEHQTLAQLDHPNIVRVFDQRLIEHGEMRLLYMEYLAGGTLADVIQSVQKINRSLLTGDEYLKVVSQSLLKRGETFSSESTFITELRRRSWPEVVCWLGTTLAQALAYADKKGVLHRDVKPANVLLNREGVPKLADFNISFSSEVEGSSPAAYFGGSLAYMSPEQLEVCHPGFPRAPADLNGSSDQYSLAMMLWEVLTGRRPFPDPDMSRGWLEAVQEMIQQRREGVSLERMQEAAQYCPDGVLSVLNRALASQPVQRFPTALELAEHFEYARDRDLQEYLKTPAHAWSERLAPWATAILMGLYFLPNFLAGVFNYFYNVEEIVYPHLQDVRVRFEMIQLTINLIAYPVGIIIGWYLIRAATMKMKPPLALKAEVQGVGCADTSAEADLPAHYSADELQSARRSALHLGHYLSLVGLSEWIVAGVTYPFSVGLAAGHMQTSDYFHFFLSLLLSGLLAISYTFSGCTWFALWCIYPRLLKQNLNLKQDIEDRQLLATRMWGYLLLAICVPLISIVAMAIGAQSQRSRIYLAVIASASLLGMGLILWSFARIQNWLRLMQETIKDTQRGK
jgi:serine/threonine protein kinase